MNLVTSEIWRPVVSWVVPDDSKQITALILSGQVDQEDFCSTCYIWWEKKLTPQSWDLSE